MNKIPYNPELAFVLGSGLDAFIDSLKPDKKIKFSEFKGLPKATNKAHKGEFVFTRLNGKNIVFMVGRLHYYEGYTMEEVVRPIRLLAKMGVKEIILTNATGGINKKFKPGDIMMIKDQISLFVPNPLRGKNDDSVGTRFPDMTTLYDLGLQKRIKSAAKKAKVKLKEGVFAQVNGPSFETPAEIKMLRKLGADNVSMSLAVEAIAARHAGMKVGGLSIITNMAAGIKKEIQSDDDVRKNAAKVSKNLFEIIKNIV